VKLTKDAKGMPVLTLSERNLIAMLAKLHQPGSACTIYNQDFTFVGESDEAHYRQREYPPGAMVNDTEHLSRLIKRAVIQFYQQESP
jgi:hypothetical protein